VCEDSVIVQVSEYIVNECIRRAVTLKALQGRNRVTDEAGSNKIPVRRFFP